MQQVWIGEMNGEEDDVKMCTSHWTKTVIETNNHFEDTPVLDT